MCVSDNTSGVEKKNLKRIMTPPSCSERAEKSQNKEVAENSNWTFINRNFDLQQVLLAPTDLRCYISFNFIVYNIN